MWEVFICANSLLESQFSVCLLYQFACLYIDLPGNKLVLLKLYHTKSAEQINRPRNCKFAGTIFRHRPETKFRDLCLGVCRKFNHLFRNLFLPSPLNLMIYHLWAKCIEVMYFGPICKSWTSKFYIG